LECSNMSLHRWERWVESDSIRELLWDAKDWLRTAWSRDQKYPKAYPVNTSYALSQTQDSLSRRPPKKGNARVLIAEPKAPKSLAELIPESLVRAIWQEHHSGSFNSAIEKAAGFGCGPNEVSWKIFSKILRTMEIAYNVSRFGDDLLPKPKISILHRGLERIAVAAGLGDQAEEGFAEFLDDLCPCGLKRHRDAIRKLRSRTRKARCLGARMPDFG
jgi:hypothetical protein